MAARGRTRAVVLKLGGELLEDSPKTRAMGRAIAAMRRPVPGVLPAPLVVVHGGGRDIDAAMARAGLEKRQVDGLRITDEATLEVVVAVLAGLVNTRLAAAVTAAGARGVGLTGADAGLGRVVKAPPHRATDGRRVDLGRVGVPRASSPRLLVDLCGRGYVPIVACIGATRRGELYNVNADTLAAHLAVALGARRLVIAGGTPGVLGATGATVPALDLPGIDRLVAAGTATAGMVAKLSACRAAVRGGVGEVLIADGRQRPGLVRLVRQGARGAGGTARRVTYTRIARTIGSDTA